MKKFWVTLTRYAGLEVEAEDEEDALSKAKMVSEDKYEYPQIIGKDWQAENAEEMEE